MKIFSNNITFFDKEEFALSEEFFLYKIFLFVIRSQIIKHIFEENNLLFVVDKFSISISCRIDNELTGSDDLVDLTRSSLEFFLLDFLIHI